MQLSAAIVVFAASLPHAVVRHPVGSFHTEHQVLDKGDLHMENTQESREYASFKHTRIDCNGQHLIVIKGQESNSTSHSQSGQEY